MRFLESYLWLNMFTILLSVVSYRRQSLYFSNGYQASIVRPRYVYKKLTRGIIPMSQAVLSDTRRSYNNTAQESQCYNVMNVIPFAV